MGIISLDAFCGQIFLSVGAKELRTLALFSSLGLLFNVKSRRILRTAFFLCIIVDSAHYCVVNVIAQIVMLVLNMVYECTSEIQ